jgi:hypothetical protein
MSRLRRPGGRAERSPPCGRRRADPAPAIDDLPGYDAHLVTDDGRHLATPGFAFVDP